MVDKTNLISQQLWAALHNFGENCLHKVTRRINKSSTRDEKFVRAGMYFIARWFCCSCWWCVDWLEDKEETACHRSSHWTVHCNTSNDFLAEQLTFTIPYANPNLVVNWAGENNILLFSWHWLADDDWILLIVTPIVDMTILTIMHVEITCQPDSSLKIQALWGCWGESNGDGGPHAHNVIAILINSTAARWVKAAMQINNAMLVCIDHSSQHADMTSGA